MVKKLLFTFLVSALIGMTLFMTNMTVSASETSENDSELQSCVSIKAEIQWKDEGPFYFHSENRGGVCIVGG